MPADLGDFRLEIDTADLKAAAKALREAGKDLPRGLGQANRRIVTKLAAGARAQARSVGGAARHVAGQVKARAGQNFAEVRLDSSGHPEAAGAEFGAARNIPHRVGKNTGSSGPRRGQTMIGWNQFKPWRGNGRDAGYFLYPTLREQLPQVRDTYLEVVEETILARLDARRAQH